MVSEDNYILEFKVLKSFVNDVFLGLGLPTEDAEICTNVLLDADLKGFDSHGVNRLKPVYYDRVRAGLQSPITRFELIREGPTTAVVDGNHGMGMVVAKRSMDLCIEKAEKLGVGIVAVRNSTHFGIAGYYAEMASNAGMIGGVCTNARPSVAPTFSVEGMLGTNPLTFALPTDEEFPFCIDCATSITQRGKIEVYAREGKTVPHGQVIGLDGEYMTDPQEILRCLPTGKAALLPLGGVDDSMGGHKGYGYSTLVEILSAALQSGSYLKALTGVNLGHFFMAIDISAFTALDDFKRTVGDILRSLRASRKAPGKDRIYTAGEKEYLTYIKRFNAGIPLNRSVQADLIQMRDELKLENRFPFE